VTATICLKTPAFGRGRVAFGDRQMVAVTFFRARRKWDPYHSAARSRRASGSAASRSSVETTNTAA
jgi:hypothetical protein